MDKDIKRTTIYLPERLHAQLIAQAKGHKRSFNSEVVWALERYVQKGGKLHAKDIQISHLSESGN
jgi:hypothetical protein